MPSTISVIAPCYNVAGFLARSIGAVLAQTRPAFEVIAADDCSTDDTVEHLERFGPPVRVLRSERNDGPAARRNDAIRAATGDYIALLDPDDWWEDDHLEVVAGLLDAFPEAGVAFSRVKLAGASTGVWPGEPPACTPTPCGMLDLLMRNPVAQASSVVFRRELFHEVGPFIDIIRMVGSRRIYGWGGDYEWQLRAASAAPFVASPEATSSYYLRPGEALASADKLIELHRYRLAALSAIRRAGRSGVDLERLLDRQAMAWREDLESIWVRREVQGLRKMCRFGVGVPHLRRWTYRYLSRGLFGGVVGGRNRAEVL